MTVVLIVAAPLWLVCGLLVWRERSLYAAQSRVARRLERLLFGRSAPILVAAPRVLRWLRKPVVLSEMTGWPQVEAFRAPVPGTDLPPVISLSASDLRVPVPGALLLVTEKNDPSALSLDSRANGSRQRNGG